MSRDALQALDEIFFASAGADFSATAAPLRPIERQRGALDVTAVGDGDEHVFLDDEVFE